MGWADRLIGTTIKPFLIIFGLATCFPILAAVDLPLGNAWLFAGMLDYTPASAPALRHWGLMICGIDVLMVVAAFRPWLRFETMVFSAVEKAFIVWLALTNLGEPWGEAYLGPLILDAMIVAYSLVYFASRHGRPHRWTRQDGEA